MKKNVSREHSRNQYRNISEEIKHKLKEREINYHDSKNNSIKISY